MLTIILVAIVLVLVVGAVVTGDWEKMDKLFGIIQKSGIILFVAVSRMADIHKCWNSSVGRALHS